MERTNTAESVGSRVKTLMREHGKTQADIATAIGLSQQAVSRRLTGEVPFDVAELTLIADHFDVSPSHFWAESPTAA